MVTMKPTKGVCGRERDDGNGQTVGWGWFLGLEVSGFEDSGGWSGY